MKSLTYCLLIFSIVISQFTFAKQEQKSNVYKSGDVACMVGDSITAGGWYTYTIMLYYATRFPDMPVDFRNVGISGDGCHGILWRMNWDILPQLDKNKAVSVLMIGMNDVGRNKFGKAEREKLGEDALNKKILSVRSNYENRLSKVIDFLAGNSRNLIVFTPSIYDQTADLPSENLFGVNDELVVFGKIGQKFAKAKPNAKTVDMSSAMLKANAKLQSAEGKDKTIIGKDRVHPSFDGGLVMLDKWLTDLNEPTEVSNIELDAKKKSATRLFNCDLSDLVFENNKISFSALEAALPFPIARNARNILKYVDFQDKYNREILKITGLEKGNYALKIDGQKIGEYSADMLANGVNLAGNVKTPQFKHAEEVNKIAKKFKSKAASYRSMFMIELFNRSQMDKLKSVDEKIEFVKTKGEKETGWIKGAYDSYIKNKKNQKALFKELKQINADMYKAAQPVPHKFEIEKI